MKVWVLLDLNRVLCPLFGSNISSRLDGLVSVLSKDEIRHLRKQLDKITLQMDICSKLPLELLVAVANYLSLEDVFTFRSVSQSWHKVFSNPAFCLSLVRIHLPSAWAQFSVRLLANPVRGVFANESFLRWFQGAVMARLRRRHGRYHSMLIYYYNYHRSGQLPRQHQIERKYNNGWVAFRMHESGVIARNLRTGFCTQYLEQNRKNIEKVAIQNC